MNMNISLASASEIKTLVSTGALDSAVALHRVDSVLARGTLTDGKKRRWTRLREFLLKNIENTDE